MTTLDLDALHLAHGGHDTPDDGLCLLEAAALFAGLPHSDQPSCVSPVLRTYGVNLNDALPDAKRQALKPFIPRLLNTANDGLDEARSYLALDWLIRTYTPAWLDLAGLTAEARALRDLRRIADLAAAEAAGPVVRDAQAKADAAGDVAGDVAWAAARAAAWDAARAAAGDVAGAAAGDVAGDVAWAAARDAAWAAAWAAARAAARAALKPTVDALQDSAIALLSQMINPAVA